MCVTIVFNYDRSVCFRRDVFHVIRAKFEKFKVCKVTAVNTNGPCERHRRDAAQISFLETGASEPSLKDIAALCRYFNVSADFLLGLPRNMDYPEQL